MPDAVDTPSVLQTLARLVVKHGVSLGLLPRDQLQLALAWVWAGLPAEAVLNEREVNAQLKAQLAGPAGPAHWLATDHVELRRWLVDAGWLQRDGYGREYRRVAAGAPAAAALAEALRGVDTVAWTAARLAAHASTRAARRQAFESGAGATATA